MRILRSNMMSMALLLVALTVPAAWAQQQTPDQSAPPIPAYHSPFASAADNSGDQDTGTQSLTPDTRSLSGAQDLTVGAPATTHSYWQPHIAVSSIGDSNPDYSTGASNWTTWTSVSGGIDLHRISGKSDMTLSYLGGGMLSNSGTSSNGIIQSLNFEDKFSFRRSTISIFDQVSYLPESAFGFGGLGIGSSLAGGSLSTAFTPSQNILTPRGQDLTNSSVLEFDEILTPRSSLTFVGGYSLLRYLDNNLLDSGDATFQGGYNYQITRKDTIAVSYAFSAYRYTGYSQSINSHTAAFTYARRVTGRLAFRGSAGPQLVYSNLPVTGSQGTAVIGSFMQVYWFAQAGLQYQFRNGGLGVSYIHGVNGGSGVLGGSLADTVTGTASRQLSRATSGSLNFGYSHNNGFSVGGSTPSGESFNYFFSGATLSHEMGRTLNLSLSYQAQYQDSNASFCVGPTCGTSVIRHLISVGLGWKKQPIPFE
jgi:hypothetical protein